MKYRYVKEHNNYDLTLNKEYDGFKYQDGWILIKSDDKGNLVSYREECFEKEQMTCDLCNKVLDPLDAHFGPLKGDLVTAHIDCWNIEIAKED